MREIDRLKKLLESAHQRVVQLVQERDQARAEVKMLQEGLNNREAAKQVMSQRLEEEKRRAESAEAEVERFKKNSDTAWERTKAEAQAHGYSLGVAETEDEWKRRAEEAERLLAECADRLGMSDRRDFREMEKKARALLSKRGE